MGKIDDIQVLRAAAIIMVAVAHSFYNTLLPEMFRHGQTGVDMFFVISGFVITRSSLRRLGSEPWWEFSRTFLLRRVARIAPPALFWLVILSAFMGWAGADVSREAWLIVTLQYNYHMDEAKWLGHYWSLMVEEHFYIAFAFILPFLVRSRTLLSVAGILILLTILFLRPYASSPVHMTHARLDSFLAGMAIAYVMPTKWVFGFVSKAFLTVLSVILIFVVATLFAFPVQEGFTWVMLASTILITIGAANQDVILPIPLFRPVLIWIGERSYSIYLSHALVVIFDFILRSRMPEYLELSPYFRAILNLAVMGALGELSYRFIEMRISSAIEGFLLKPRSVAS